MNSESPPFLPDRSTDQLEPLDYELLHTVTQRALRQILEGAPDRPTLLAQIRRELAAVLGSHAGPASRREQLLAEFEAVLARLEAAQLTPPQGRLR